LRCATSRSATWSPRPANTVATITLAYKYDMKKIIAFLALGLIARHTPRIFRSR
jgi:hypothetical protein